MTAEQIARPERASSPAGPADAARRTAPALRRRLRGQTPVIAAGVVVVLAATVALVALGPWGPLRGALLLLAGAVGVGSATAGAGALHLHRRARSRDAGGVRVLVVGAGGLARHVVDRLRADPSSGVRVVGYINDGPSGPADLEWLGGIAAVPEVLSARVIDEVAICLPPDREELIGDVVRLCEEQGKAVRLPLDLPAGVVPRGRVEHLAGMPLVRLASAPDQRVALAVKRCMDIVGSLVLIAVTAPLQALIAGALWVQDGRPIMYAGVRAGLHGRWFRCHKFRTMCADADERRDELAGRNSRHGPDFKVSADPRVHRVGRVLRATSLDELPQFINVLQGEMSLVGPRPQPVDEVAGYERWHRRRLSVKPGITGLWQVQARNDPFFDRRVRLDLAYIDNWSLWFDVKILALTIPALLRGTDMPRPSVRVPVADPFALANPERRRGAR